MIPPRSNFSRGLAGLLAAGIFLQAASCGVLIHPDRVGQPHRGRLDTSIVLLDALGLLLFFIPGVIAFVVDFSTGAIYLPANECTRTEGAEREGDYYVVRVEPGTISRDSIETVLKNHTGRSIRLEPGEYEARELKKLDQFKSETESIALRNATTGSAVQFRAQSQEGSASPREIQWASGTTP